MPWRDEDCYKKAYELIQSATPFPWPENLDVMMDFEQAIIHHNRIVSKLIYTQAMRNAWSALHPSHKLRGCMFHMTQVKKLRLFFRISRHFHLFWFFFLESLEVCQHPWLLNFVQCWHAQRTPISRLFCEYDNGDANDDIDDIENDKWQIIF